MSEFVDLFRAATGAPTGAVMRGKAQVLTDGPYLEAKDLVLGARDAARRHFQVAHVLARNDAERRFLDLRIPSCRGG